MAYQHYLLTSAPPRQCFYLNTNLQSQSLAIQNRNVRTILTVKLVVDMISTTVMESRTKVSKPATKSKRVRTGCLTCRERHLKCDEAAPVCLNCRKGNRNCRRGIRLNFLQVDVCRPRYLAFVKDWDGDCRISVSAGYHLTDLFQLSSKTNRARSLPNTGVA